MENTQIKFLLATAIRAALEAGSMINEVYENKDFEVEAKADESPLTLADRKSHDIILQHMNSTDIPVLSEEGKDISYEERSHWNYFWLVDPLDGTKEFIKRNGEFTVNIALIKKDKPLMGVVYAPYVGDLYFGTLDLGAYKIEGIYQENADFETPDELIKKGQKLPVSEKHDKLLIVASRSHMNEDTQSYVNALKKKYGDTEFISKGSSLKICMVAEGKADVYPRFAPTMEWDTAAGHAIALAAGFPVTQKDESTPLLYNKAILKNPHFIVKAKDL